QQKIGTQRSEVISITNKGEKALTITVETTPSGFLLVNNCKTSLNFSDTCQISLTFFPIEKKDYTGNISINSNAKNGKQVLVLSGKGVNSEQPLKIMDVSTIDNTSNVSLSGNLNLNFDQDLIKGSCFNNIRLLDGNNNIITIKVTLVDKQLAIDPTTNFINNENYTLNIPDCAIQSKQGAYLENALSYNFNTGNSPFSSPVIAIAAGSNHVLALRKDGTVWSWGENNKGQLGNGTTKTSFSPIQVVGTNGSGITQNVKKVFSFGENSLLIDNMNVAYSWGDNFSGRTGTASSYQEKKMILTPHYSESQVKEVLAATSFLTTTNKENIYGVSSSTSSGELKNMYRTIKETTYLDLNTTPLKTLLDNSYFVKKDGLVWGKICSYFFRCNYDYRNLPTLYNIERMHYWAKEQYYYAVNTVGEVFAWKGYLTTFPSDNDRWTNLPQKIAGLSDVQKMVTSQSHVLVLKQDGSIWGWGDNSQGQLSVKASLNQRTPINIVSETAGKFIDIAAGNGFSVALRDDGVVFVWGDDTKGQAGNGANIAKKYTLTQALIGKQAKDLDS
ncbi:MAG: Ig-like domain-containing protein, partial [Cocleimonas sp.]|nr:Ig-like domain-containing protein [Cocleimonas sp.]